MAGILIPFLGPWSGRETATLTIVTGVFFVALGLFWLWVASHHTDLSPSTPWAFGLVAAGATLSIVGTIWFRKSRSRSAVRRSEVQ